MQRLKTCCGCCDLKTGTLIVGICGILFTIGGIITHTVGLENIEDESSRDHVKVMIIYSYIYSLVDFMLIYGAIKESKYFLLPWIAAVAFGLSLFSVFCLIFMFFVPGLIIGTFISAGLWYVWYCVVSFYNDLNQPRSTIVSVGGYPGITQAVFMAPSVVTYEQQPPTYAELGKTPDAV
ncbi:hypothetical protein ILUMI_27151 [Ignelater luminosus]|uniref:Uncharacterized protein n=1 Tax=Ignelater luminosus TaxID=2038154 RepID=A0A8K0C5M6_IGNLU|nr:hypothetical protein ILUMI_27151 [Ignelater luminosus]